MTERPIGELRLRDEGVLVLGVVRSDGTYEGAPRKQTCVEPGDTAILYGRTGTVSDIARRRAGPLGDAEHGRHVAE